MRSDEVLKEVSRIAKTIALEEFPWDIQRALEVALVRSFAVPAISSQLVATGRLINRTEERVDRTDKLLMEVLRCGVVSAEGQSAIRKIKAAHEGYHIINENYLFVLSTFVFEPIDWIAVYGKRRLNKKEEDAWFVFWAAVGEGMGIKNIPSTLEDFRFWKNDFEEKSVRYSPDNKRLLDAVLGLLRKHSKLPRFVIDNIFSSLFDERVRAAFGMNVPAPFSRQILAFLFAVRRAAAGFHFTKR